MTAMKRVTITIPSPLDNKILELRKTDKFVRCSYSELVRQALEHGLELMADKPKETE